MDAPPSNSPTDTTAPRHVQLGLVALVLLLAGLLAHRGYSTGTARPTEHHPATIARQIDLNTASKPELLQVPGVGPQLADAILTHRRDRGRFTSVDELDRVHGVGGKTLDKLRPWLTVSDAAGDEEAPPELQKLERKRPPATGRGKLQPGDAPIDVNAADETELQRLPGVGPTLAQRIIEARAVERFKSPDDLRRVKGIGVKTLEGMRPFVTVQ